MSMTRFMLSRVAIDVPPNLQTFISFINTYLLIFFASK